MFCGSPACDLPICSLLEMENRSNGEVFAITLSVQPIVNITLGLKK
jgi:hypothetical protein